MTVRQKHICRVAERLIVSNGVKEAPIPVEQLAGSLGAEIRCVPADDDLSGFLIRSVNGFRAVIGVNSKHHPNRQRFTIAHEIGHLLLHEGDKVHVDRIGQVYQINLRSDASSSGNDVVEIEANAFAAELLMPSDFLKVSLSAQRTLDLQDEDVLDTLIKPLSRKYGVSTQALTYRLGRLGYVHI